VRTVSYGACGCVAPQRRSILRVLQVMVWGGLRGAVSLSLALMVDGNHLIGALPLPVQRVQSR
jgi:NhaP-type Na+/H+ or K+/H+ antiporter